MQPCDDRWDQANGQAPRTAPVPSFPVNMAALRVRKPSEGFPDPCQGLSENLATSSSRLRPLRLARRCRRSSTDGSRLPTPNRPFLPSLTDVVMAHPGKDPRLF